MKGVLMSFWSLAVTVGSLWVLLVNASVKGPAASAWVTRVSGVSVTAFQMYFFAGFAFVAALLFGLYAVRYKMLDHYRK
jgi:POT family proton-dependent oligopeptide transporter